MTAVSDLFAVDPAASVAFPLKIRAGHQGEQRAGCPNSKDRRQAESMLGRKPHRLPSGARSRDTQPYVWKVDGGA